MRKLLLQHATMEGIPMGYRICFWTAYVLTIIPMIIYYTTIGIIDIVVHKFTKGAWK